MFASFEPVSRTTKEVVNEVNIVSISIYDKLCRQMKTLYLVEFNTMSDAEFISLIRLCVFFACYLDDVVK